MKSTSPKPDASSSPVASSPEESGFSSLWYRAKDGLKLHARLYGPPSSDDLLPVICLPGLARTAADFHEVALELSAGTIAGAVFPPMIPIPAVMTSLSRCRTCSTC
jgi:hypothetical protein